MPHQNGPAWKEVKSHIWVTQTVLRDPSPDPFRHVTPGDPPKVTGGDFWEIGPRLDSVEVPQTDGTGTIIDA